MFISLKDVKGIEKKDLPCADTTFNHITIFSANVIFINDNINKKLLSDINEMVPIIIFATKWEIVGRIEFLI